MPTILNPATIPTRAQFEADFRNDANIRAEFMTIENYVAFKTAEAKGQIRILSGQVDMRGRPGVPR